MNLLFLYIIGGIIAVALVLLLCVLIKMDRESKREKREFSKIFDEEYKKGNKHGDN